MRFLCSLTTTPRRLQKLEPTLDSLLMQSVSPEYIIVNIPYESRRGGSYGDLPPFLYKDARIILNRGIDYGPVTKLVGGLELVWEKVCEETWMVVVDDDVRYPSTLLEVYQQSIKDAGRSAYGFAGLVVERGRYVQPLGNRQDMDVLEAFASVALHPSFFTRDDFMSYLSHVLAHQDCLYSDDLVISHYLQRNGVRLVLLRNDIVNRRAIVSSVLVHGRDRDALHRGGADGLTNVQRYQRAHRLLDVSQ